MCRRLFTLWAACWILSACRTDRDFGPCARVHCPIGRECNDGKCLPIARLDATVSGEPDAQLAPNQIPVLPAPDASVKPTTVDASVAQPEAAVPDAAQPDAAPTPVYRMQGASLALPDSRPSGLRMIDQRLDRNPIGCAAISGSQLCITGGIAP